ncbi:hypothetical protein Bbelb_307790 [Branchiostoma belcheri]|nr:hypothetical protein Bbelb_307790 [Branchiostoma belcheri]
MFSSSPCEYRAVMDYPEQPPRSLLNLPPLFNYSRLPTVSLRPTEVIISPSVIADGRKQCPKEAVGDYEDLQTEQRPGETGLKMNEVIETSDLLTDRPKAERRQACREAGRCVNSCTVGIRPENIPLFFSGSHPDTKPVPRRGHTDKVSPTGDSSAENRPQNLVLL